MGCKTSKNSKTPHVPSHEMPLDPEVPREPEIDDSDSFVEATDEEKNSESLVQRPEDLCSSSESQNISPKTPTAEYSMYFDVKTGLDYTVEPNGDNLKVARVENEGAEYFDAQTGLDYAVDDPKLKIEPEDNGAGNEERTDYVSDEFDDSEDMTELRDLKYTEETGDSSSDSPTARSSDGSSEASGLAIIAGHKTLKR